MCEGSPNGWSGWNVRNLSKKDQLAGSGPPRRPGLGLGLGL